MRNGLRAFRDQLQDAARVDYRHAVLCWAVRSPHYDRLKPPALPAILRDLVE